MKATYNKTSYIEVPVKERLKLGWYKKNSKNTDPHIFYGLPEKVEYCKRCTLSNQKPNSTVEFQHTINTKKSSVNLNEDGVCDACVQAEFKKNIDWDKREKELVELLEKHRSKDGSYDCLVPGSP